jgi:hypothetical protein
MFSVQSISQGCGGLVERPIPFRERWQRRWWDEGGRGGLRRQMLLHRDRRHEAITLAVQGVDAARRAPPLLQCLAQLLNTGFQRLVSDKLVRPQMLEDLLLEGHPVAMGQEVGEHLKDFAPELNGHSSTM